MSEQKESVFSVLSSYCPQPAMNPKENYLTELLAWIINNVEVFGNRFVEFLINEANLSVSAVIENSADSGQNIEAVTQQYVSSGYIDMLVYDNRYKVAFICEHKINSPLGNQQIQKYMEKTGELLSGFHYVSVLLAKSSDIQYSEQAMIRLAWREITQLTVDILKDDIMLLSESDRFILEQFVNFMNAEGLGMTESINGELLKGYSHLIEEIKEKQQMTGLIQNRIEQICRSLADSDFDWKSIIPELSAFPGIRNDKEPKYERYKWGRVGISFSDRPWNPGLFAGVVLDVEDHKLQLVDPDKGPDIVVLLDVESKDKYQLLNSDNEWNLRLKERRNNGPMIKTSNRIWKFSYGEEVRSDWRIAVLQTPLLDVISEGKNLEDQQNRMRECFIEGIQLLLSK